MSEFFELIKEGFRLAANFGQMTLDAVKATVLGYFAQVKKWTIRFAVAAAAPLLIIVPCLIFKLTLGGLYGTYVVWIVLLAAAELLLLAPMFFVWRRLNVLFPNVASELQEWLDFLKSVLVNGLSLGIFVTLFPIWRAPGALPLLLLVLACWITLPACGISSFCRRIYPTIRAIQLSLLFGLLVIQMAFPRHMEQIMWSASRTIGGAITRSVEQNEITSKWKDVQWFNNQGEPQVWYSGSESEGFRLWAAPGFDPATGRELRAPNEKIRDQILGNFTERERRENARQMVRAAEQRRQAEAEKIRLAAIEAERMQREEAEKKRLAAKEKKRQAERAELDKQLQMEAEQRAIEMAEVRKREYIARHLRPTVSLKSPGKLAIAVGVVNTEGRLDEATAMQLSSLFPPLRINATGSLFTPAFADDGLLQKLLDSETDELAGLGLPALTDYLLLGTYSVEFTKSQFEGIITAKIEFRGRVLHSQSGAVVETLVLASSGAGFANDAAETVAKERLIKSLTTYRWQFLPSEPAK